jgi:hypothetical protein
MFPITPFFANLRNDDLWLGMTRSTKLWIAPQPHGTGLGGVGRRLTSKSLCPGEISILTEFLAGIGTTKNEAAAPLLGCVVAEMPTFPEKGIKREYCPQASV